MAQCYDNTWVMLAQSKIGPILSIGSSTIRLAVILILMLYIVTSCMEQ